MADEKVSSWFVPQNILDLVSPKEAEAAASQARNTFLMGLLSGDVGAAYNNAQNQGYNTLSHGAALQEAKRKQVELDNLNQLKGSAYDFPQAGPVKTLDTGRELAGPSQPLPPVFNPQKILNNPMAPFVDQTHLKTLMENFGPQIEFVNGMAVNKRTVAPGTMIPKVAENQTLVADPSAPGGYRTGVIPGAASAVSQLEGAGAFARENAKASFKLSPVTAPDGSTLYLTDKQIATAATNNQPFKANLSPLQQGVQQADASLYKTYREDSQNKALSAPDRRLSAETVYALADRLDGNKLTPLKAEVTAYAKAFGLTGPEADTLLGDVALFNKARAVKNLQGLSSIKGNANEAELATVSSASYNIADPKAQTKFNSALEIAIANKDEARDKFIQQYKGDPKELGVAWAQAPENVRVYRDPKVVNFIADQVKEGKTLPAGFEVIEYNKKRHVVFPDGTNAVLK
jgi:hypothetical protein